MPVPGFITERLLCIVEKSYHMVADLNQADETIHPAQIRAPYAHCDFSCLSSCNKQCRNECCGWWGPL